MRSWIKAVSVAVLICGVLLVAPLAQAEDKCVPISGTVYFWYTDTWHGVADFTIGRQVLRAEVLAVNTSFFEGGNVAVGTEAWTLDFGKGQKANLTTTFTIEHMTDAVAASGVMHVIEVAKFAKGTGVFRNAYGNLSAHGPFGPSVKLPDDITTPSDAIMLGVLPSQGMICGLK